MSIDKILEERGNSYGSFEANVKAISAIMGELHKVHNDKEGHHLNLLDATNLQYQVIKLVRLAATPNHKDSWQDIQGYAKLSEEYYDGSK